MVRPLAALAALLVLAGLGLLGYAASLGQVQVALVLVVPVIVGSGPWALLGSLALMAGLFAGFAAWAARSAASTAATHVPWERPPGGPGPRAWGEERGDHASRRSRAGGFLLIGPIPIAFGSTKAMAVAMLLIALAVVALLLLLPFLAPFVLRGSR